VGEIPGHNRHTPVDVAHLHRQLLHHPLQVEPSRRRVGPRDRRTLWHRRPPLLGEPSHLSDAVVAQDVGVAVHGVDEDVPLTVNLKGEQPAGGRDRVRLYRTARVVVEVDPAEGVLGQLDHRLAMPGR
jgi:hypothetical protein